MPDRRRKRLEKQFGKGNVSSVDEGACRRIRVGKFWGLFSPTGEPVVEPRFDYICHFDSQNESWLAIRLGRCFVVKIDDGQAKVSEINLWNRLSA